MESANCLLKTKVENLETCRKPSADWKLINVEIPDRNVYGQLHNEKHERFSEDIEKCSIANAEEPIPDWQQVTNTDASHADVTLESKKIWSEDLSQESPGDLDTDDAEINIICWQSKFEDVLQELKLKPENREIMQNNELYENNLKKATDDTENKMSSLEISKEQGVITDKNDKIIKIKTSSLSTDENFSDICIIKSDIDTYSLNILTPNEKAEVDFDNEQFSCEMEAPLASQETSKSCTNLLQISQSDTEVKKLVMPQAFETDIHLQNEHSLTKAEMDETHPKTLAVGDGDETLFTNITALHKIVENSRNRQSTCETDLYFAHNVHVSKTNGNLPHNWSYSQTNRLSSRKHEKDRNSPRKLSSCEYVADSQSRLFSCETDLYSPSNLSSSKSNKQKQLFYEKTPSDNVFAYETEENPLRHLLSSENVTDSSSTNLSMSSKSETSEKMPIDDTDMNSVHETLSKESNKYDNDIFICKTEIEKLAFHEIDIDSVLELPYYKNDQSLPHVMSSATCETNENETAEKCVKNVSSEEIVENSVSNSLPRDLNGDYVLSSDTDRNHFKLFFSEIDENPPFKVSSNEILQNPLANLVCSETYEKLPVNVPCSKINGNSPLDVSFSETDENAQPQISSDETEFFSCETAGNTQLRKSFNRSNENPSIQESSCEKDGNTQLKNTLSESGENPPVKVFSCQIDGNNQLKISFIESEENSSINVSSSESKENLPNNISCSETDANLTFNVPSSGTDRNSQPKMFSADTDAYYSIKLFCSETNRNPPFEMSSSETDGSNSVKLSTCETARNTQHKTSFSESDETSPMKVSSCETDRTQHKTSFNETDETPPVKVSSCETDRTQHKKSFSETDETPPMKVSACETDRTQHKKSFSETDETPPMKVSSCETDRTQHKTSFSETDETPPMKVSSCETDGNIQLKMSFSKSDENQIRVSSCETDGNTQLKMSFSESYESPQVKASFCEIAGNTKLKMSTGEADENRPHRIFSFGTDENTELIEPSSEMYGKVSDEMVLCETDEHTQTKMSLREAEKILPFKMSFNETDQITMSPSETDGNPPIKHESSPETDQNSHTKMTISEILVNQSVNISSNETNKNPLLKVFSSKTSKHIVNKISTSKTDGKFSTMLSLNETVGNTQINVSSITTDGLLSLSLTFSDTQEKSANKMSSIETNENVVTNITSRQSEGNSPIRISSSQSDGSIHINMSFSDTGRPHLTKTFFTESYEMPINNVSSSLITEDPQTSMPSSEAESTPVNSMFSLETDKIILNNMPISEMDEHLSIILPTSVGREECSSSTVTSLVTDKMSSSERDGHLLVMMSNCGAEEYPSNMMTSFVTGEISVNKMLSSALDGQHENIFSIETGHPPNIMSAAKTNGYSVKMSSGEANECISNTKCHFEVDGQYSSHMLIGETEEYSPSMLSTETDNISVNTIFSDESDGHPSNMFSGVTEECLPNKKSDSENDEKDIREINEYFVKRKSSMKIEEISVNELYASETDRFSQNSWTLSEVEGYHVNNMLSNEIDANSIKMLSSHEINESIISSISSSDTDVHSVSMPVIEADASPSNKMYSIAIDETSIVIMPSSETIECAQNTRSFNELDGKPQRNISSGRKREYSPNKLSTIEADEISVNKASFNETNGQHSDNTSSITYEDYPPSRTSSSETYESCISKIASVDTDGHSVYSMSFTDTEHLSLEMLTNEMDKNCVRKMAPINRDGHSLGNLSLMEIEHSPIKMLSTEADDNSVYVLYSSETDLYSNNMPFSQTDPYPPRNVPPSESDDISQNIVSSSETLEYSTNFMSFTETNRDFPTNIPSDVTDEYPARKASESDEVSENIISSSEAIEYSTNKISSRHSPVNMPSDVKDPRKTSLIESEVSDSSSDTDETFPNNTSVSELEDYVPIKMTEAGDTFVCDLATSETNGDTVNNESFIETNEDTVNKVSFSETNEDTVNKVSFSETNEDTVNKVSFSEINEDTVIKVTFSETNKDTVNKVSSSETNGDPENNVSFSETNEDTVNKVSFSETNKDTVNKVSSSETNGDSVNNVSFSETNEDTVNKMSSSETNKDSINEVSSSEINGDPVNNVSFSETNEDTVNKVSFSETNEDSVNKVSFGETNKDTVNKVSFSETNEDTVNKVSSSEINEATVNKVFSIETNEDTVKKVSSSEINEATVNKVSSSETIENTVNKMSSSETNEVTVNKVSSNETNEGSVNMMVSSETNDDSVNKVSHSETNEDPINKESSSETNEGSINKMSSSETNEDTVNKVLSIGIKEDTLNKLPSSETNESSGNMMVSSETNEDPVSKVPPSKANEFPVNMMSSSETNAFPVSKVSPDETNEFPVNKASSSETIDFLVNEVISTKKVEHHPSNRFSIDIYGDSKERITISENLQNKISSRETDENCEGIKSYQEAGVSHVNKMSFIERGKSLSDKASSVERDEISQDMRSITDTEGHLQNKMHTFEAKEALVKMFSQTTVECFPCQSSGIGESSLYTVSSSEAEVNKSTSFSEYSLNTVSFTESDENHLVTVTSTEINENPMNTKSLSEYDVKPLNQITFTEKASNFIHKMVLSEFDGNCVNMQVAVEKDDNAPKQTISYETDNNFVNIQVSDEIEENLPIRMTSKETDDNFVNIQVSHEIEDKHSNRISSSETNENPSNKMVSSESHDQVNLMACSETDGDPVNMIPSCTLSENSLRLMTSIEIVEYFVHQLTSSCPDDPENMMAINESNENPVKLLPSSKSNESFVGQKASSEVDENLPDMMADYNKINKMASSEIDEICVKVMDSFESIEHSVSMITPSESDVNLASKIDSNASDRKSVKLEPFNETGHITHQMTASESDNNPENIMDFHETDKFLPDMITSILSDEKVNKCAFLDTGGTFVSMVNSIGKFEERMNSSRLDGNMMDSSESDRKSVHRKSSSENENFTHQVPSSGSDTNHESMMTSSETDEIPSSKIIPIVSDEEVNKLALIETNGTSVNMVGSIESFGSSVKMSNSSESERNSIKLVPSYKTEDNFKHQMASNESVENPDLMMDFSETNKKFLNAMNCSETDSFYLNNKISNETNENPPNNMASIESNDQVNMTASSETEGTFINLMDASKSTEAYVSKMKSHKSDENSATMIDSSESDINSISMMDSNESDRNFVNFMDFDESVRISVKSVSSSEADRYHPNKKISIETDESPQNSMASRESDDQVNMQICKTDRKFMNRVTMSKLDEDENSLNKIAPSEKEESPNKMVFSEIDKNPLYKMTSNMIDKSHVDINVSIDTIINPLNEITQSQRDENSPKRAVSTKADDNPIDVLVYSKPDENSLNSLTLNESNENPPKKTVSTEADDNPIDVLVYSKPDENSLNSVTVNESNENPPNKTALSEVEENHASVNMMSPSETGETPPNKMNSLMTKLAIHSLKNMSVKNELSSPRNYTVSPYTPLPYKSEIPVSLKLHSVVTDKSTPHGWLVGQRDTVTSPLKKMPLGEANEKEKGTTQLENVVHKEPVKPVKLRRSIFEKPSSTLGSESNHLSHVPVLKKVPYESNSPKQLRKFNDKKSTDHLSHTEQMVAFFSNMQPKSAATPSHKSHDFSQQSHLYKPKRCTVDQISANNTKLKSHNKEVNLGNEIVKFPNKTCEYKPDSSKLVKKELENVLSNAVLDENAKHNLNQGEPQNTCFDCKNAINTGKISGNYHEKCLESHTNVISQFIHRDSLNPRSMVLEQKTKSHASEHKHEDKKENNYIVNETTKDDAQNLNYAKENPHHPNKMGDQSIHEQIFLNDSCKTIGTQNSEKSEKPDFHTNVDKEIEQNVEQRNTETSSDVSDLSLKSTDPIFQEDLTPSVAQKPHNPTNDLGLIQDMPPDKRVSNKKDTPSLKCTNQYHFKPKPFNLICSLESLEVHGRRIPSETQTESENLNKTLTGTQHCNNISNDLNNTLVDLANVIDSSLRRIHNPQSPVEPSQKSYFVRNYIDSKVNQQHEEKQISGHISGKDQISLNSPKSTSEVHSSESFLINKSQKKSIENSENLSSLQPKPKSAEGISSAGQQPSSAGLRNANPKTETTSGRNSQCVEAVLLLMQSMQNVLLHMSKMAAYIPALPGEEMETHQGDSRKQLFSPLIVNPATRKPCFKQTGKLKVAAPGYLHAYNIANYVVSQARKKISELFPECAERVDSGNVKDYWSTALVLTGMRETLNELEDTYRLKSHVSVGTSHSFTEDSNSITSLGAVNSTSASENKVLNIHAAINQKPKFNENQCLSSSRDDIDHNAGMDSDDRLELDIALCSLRDALAVLSKIQTSSLKSAYPILNVSSQAPVNGKNTKAKDSVVSGPQNDRLCDIFTERAFKPMKSLILKLVQTICEEVLNMVSEIFDHLETNDFRENCNASSLTRDILLHCISSPVNATAEMKDTDKICSKIAEMSVTDKIYGNIAEMIAADKTCGDIAEMSVTAKTSNISEMRDTDNTCGNISEVGATNKTCIIEGTSEISHTNSINTDSEALRTEKTLKCLLDKHLSNSLSDESTTSPSEFLQKKLRENLTAKLLSMNSVKNPECVKLNVNNSVHTGSKIELNADQKNLTVQNSDTRRDNTDKNEPDQQSTSTGMLQSDSKPNSIFTTTSSQCSQTETNSSIECYFNSALSQSVSDRFSNQRPSCGLTSDYSFANTSRSSSLEMLEQMNSESRWCTGHDGPLHFYTSSNVVFVAGRGIVMHIGNNAEHVPLSCMCHPTHGGQPCICDNVESPNKRFVTSRSLTTTHTPPMHRRCHCTGLSTPNQVRNKAKPHYQVLKTPKCASEPNLEIYSRVDALKCCHSQRFSPDPRNFVESEWSLIRFMPQDSQVSVHSNMYTPRNELNDNLGNTPSHDHGHVVNESNAMVNLSANSKVDSSNEVSHIVSSGNEIGTGLANNLQHSKATNSPAQRCKVFSYNFTDTIPEDELLELRHHGCKITIKPLQLQTAEKSCNVEETVELSCERCWPCLCPNNTENCLDNKPPLCTLQNEAMYNNNICRYEVSTQTQLQSEIKSKDAQPKGQISGKRGHGSVHMCKDWHASPTQINKGALENECHGFIPRTIVSSSGYSSFSRSDNLPFGSDHGCCTEGNKGQEEKESCLSMTASKGYLCRSCGNNARENAMGHLDAQAGYKQYDVCSLCSECKLSFQEVAQKVFLVRKSREKEDIRKQGDFKHVACVHHKYKTLASDNGDIKCCTLNTDCKCNIKQVTSKPLLKCSTAGIPVQLDLCVTQNSGNVHSVYNCIHSKVGIPPAPVKRNNAADVTGTEWEHSFAQKDGHQHGACNCVQSEKGTALNIVKSNSPAVVPAHWECKAAQNNEDKPRICARSSGQYQDHTSRREVRNTNGTSSTRVKTEVDQNMEKIWSTMLSLSSMFNSVQRENTQTRHLIQDLYRYLKPSSKAPLPVGSCQTTSESGIQPTGDSETGMHLAHNIETGTVKGKDWQQSCPQMPDCKCHTISNPCFISEREDFCKEDCTDDRSLCTSMDSKSFDAGHRCIHYETDLKIMTPAPTDVNASAICFDNCGENNNSTKTNIEFVDAKSYFNSFKIQYGAVCELGVNSVTRDKVSANARLADANVSAHDSSLDILNSLDECNSIFNDFQSRSSTAIDELCTVNELQPNTVSLSMALDYSNSGLESEYDSSNDDSIQELDIFKDLSCGISSLDTSNPRISSQSVNIKPGEDLFDNSAAHNIEKIPVCQQRNNCKVKQTDLNNRNKCACHICQLSKTKDTCLTDSCSDESDSLTGPFSHTSAFDIISSSDASLNFGTNARNDSSHFSTGKTLQSFQLPVDKPLGSGTVSQGTVESTVPANLVLCTNAADCTNSQGFYIDSVGSDCHKKAQADVNVGTDYDKCRTVRGCDSETSHQLLLGKLAQFSLETRLDTVEDILEKMERYLSEMSKSSKSERSNARVSNRQAEAEAISKGNNYAVHNVCSTEELLEMVQNQLSSVQSIKDVQKEMATGMLGYRNKNMNYGHNSDNVNAAGKYIIDSTLAASNSVTALNSCRKYITTKDSPATLNQTSNASCMAEGKYTITPEFADTRKDFETRHKNASHYAPIKCDNFMESAHVTDMQAIQRSGISTVTYCQITDGSNREQSIAPALSVKTHGRSYCSQNTSDINSSSQTLKSQNQKENILILTSQRKEKELNDQKAVMELITNKGKNTEDIDNLCTSEDTSSSDLSKIFSDLPEKLSSGQDLIQVLKHYKQCIQSLKSELKSEQNLHHITRAALHALEHDHSDLRMQISHLRHRHGKSDKNSRLQEIMARTQCIPDFPDLMPNT